MGGAFIGVLVAGRVTAGSGVWFMFGGGVVVLGVMEAKVDGVVGAFGVGLA